MPLFDRILPKLRIHGHDLDLIRTIPEFAMKPPLSWPQELHLPWIWTGAVTPARLCRNIRRDKEGIKVVYHNWSPSRPRFRIKGKTISVNRILYELMIGPIPPNHRLRYRGDHWGLNVNPLFWFPKFHSPGGYNFTARDFEVDATEMSGELPYPEDVDQDIRELADYIEEKYMLNPFRSLDELLNRIPHLVEDYSRDEINQAYELTGLQKRFPS